MDKVIELAKQLDTKAGMILMGEAIAWGSDSALMQQAAIMLRDLEAENEQLRKERQAFKDVTEYQKAENARFRLALEKIANFTDRPINTAREALGEK